MTSMMVTGYNQMADSIKWVGNKVPFITLPIEIFAKQILTTDGFKTFAVKPLILMKATLQRMGCSSRYPILEKLSNHTAMPLLSSVEGVAKVYNMFETLASPIVRDGDYLTKDCTRIYMKDWQIPLSLGEALAKRASFVVSGLIGAVVSVESLIRVVDGKIPEVWKNYAPLTSVGIGYTALCTLYEENKILNDKTISNRERVFVCVNMLSSFACLFSSAMTIADRCCGGNRLPIWFDKLQYAAQVGSTVAPIVQKSFKYYMDTRVYKIK
jgi:hypothetical protein